MANKSSGKINVVRKVKVDGAWRFLSVAKVGDRLDWTKLLSDGKTIPSISGTFYLDYQERGKRARRAVGDHPREAKAALTAQGSVIQLRSVGVKVEDAPQIAAYRPASGKRIADVVAGFLAKPPVKLRPRSVAKYSDAVRAFGDWASKTHVSQLDRQDILDFMEYLVRQRGLDMSTAIDKAVIALAVTNEHGASIKMKRGDWPRVTEQQRAIYKPETLKALFAVATREEFALFQAFLMTGFRDQEIGFLSWEDFDAKRGTLSVTKKNGFDPKSYHERTIPVPKRLVEILQKHRKTQDAGEYLIFPTSESNAGKGCAGGQRDRHMLDRLKRLAKRAGLNCGRCQGTYLRKLATCKDKPICQKFGLHMFRHTYATTMLHDGVDLRSLQFLLGHATLEATQKYIRCLEAEDLSVKIRGTSIATRFCA